MMISRFRRLLPALASLMITGATAGLHAQTPAPAAPVAAPADGTADADWAAFQSSAPKPATPYAEMTKLQKAQYVESRATAIRSAGLDFIAKHPTDPRRWQIVISFDPDSPKFVTEWAAPDASGDVIKATDTAAAAAWSAKVADLKAQMEKAPDVPPEVKEAMAGRKLIAPFTAAMMASEKGQAVDLPTLRKQLDAAIASAPNNRFLGNAFYYYMALFEDAHPDGLAAEYQTFVSSPAPKIRDQAVAKVKFYELLKSPIDIKFTAVDGREVDISKLRGKVVLVDFWATWCGPCVAELPNVRKAYEAFHDKGFEIVGISLDRAPDKQKLINFTQSHQMPWPQYFDGKFWQNEISTHYAIMAIPAMFLLDQNGMVVSTNARGEKLHTEIKRLLKLN